VASGAHDALRQHGALQRSQNAPSPPRGDDARGPAERMLPHRSNHLPASAPAPRAADERTGSARAWQRRMQEQQALLDHARDAIVLHGLDGCIEYWNGGAERLFGYDRNAAIGRTFAELMGPGAELDHAARQQLVERGAWNGVRECVDARGQMLSVERRCTLMPIGEAQTPTVVAIDTDVTERRRAEKEIVLLNNLLEQRIRSRTAQLEESNEALRGLAYSIAHDLRAPLASVDVFSEQLQQRAQGLDERSAHYLQRVRAGVQLMSELTNGLLALANLSNAPLLHHSVDLSALAAAAVERLREHEPRRAVTVTIHETPRTEGDVRLLTDVMENLLGNAWKFTSRTDRACIEFGADPAADGGCRYWVRDNGAGFDPAYAYKLFKPFQRLHTVDEFSGTGIGLAIVRKIVARHGGRIWAESPPGGGAVFSFTLGGPLAGAPRP
jgi:PAS domain S-box-containing protein